MKKNYNSWKLHIFPISVIGSTAVEPVVPTVDTTKKGINPFALSSLILSSNSVTGKLKSSFVPIIRSCEMGIPVMKKAFVTDE